MKATSRPCTYLARRICKGYCTNYTGKDNNIKLPPEPTNCCMSGCANCVWIEYADTLAKLFQDGGDKARQIIMDKVSDPNMRAFLSTELRIIQMKQNDNKPEKT